jgi:hypothetical protein
VCEAIPCRPYQHTTTLLDSFRKRKLSQAAAVNNDRSNSGLLPGCGNRKETRGDHTPLSRRRPSVPWARERWWATTARLDTTARGEAHVVGQVGGARFPPSVPPATCPHPVLCCAEADRGREAHAIHAGAVKASSSHGQRSSPPSLHQTRLYTLRPTPAPLYSRGHPHRPPPPPRPRQAGRLPLNSSHKNPSIRR